MVRLRAIGRQVHHQWDRSAVVEEVHRHGGGAVVGTGEPAVEVRQQVDLGAVVHAGGEYTWDCDADIRLGVVADDGGVHHQRQKGRLVRGRVLLQQRGGVIVANGGVHGTLRKRGAHKGKSCELEKHVGGLFDRSSRFLSVKKRGIARIEGLRE